MVAEERCELLCLDLPRTEEIGGAIDAALARETRSASPRAG